MGLTYLTTMMYSIETDERKTTANSTFAVGGVSCYAVSLVIAESFALRMNINGKNPTQRKSANVMPNFKTRQQ